MNMYILKKSLSCAFLTGITLVALSVHAVTKNLESAAITTHFIPGFITTQPTNIPLSGGEAREITGKLGGTSFGAPAEFTAIRLGDNSFLAQTIFPDGSKKGVFFEIIPAVFSGGVALDGVFFETNSNSKIQVTQARYCLPVECQNRNLALTDHQGHIATSQESVGYSIFDVTISIAETTTHFIPIVTTQPVAVPSLMSSVITKIIGKISDGSTSGSVNFTAIKLDSNSFLAQVSWKDKKIGVFFEIEDNFKIKTTQGRSCLIRNCPNRNLLLTDTEHSIVTDKETGGFNIFDITLFTLPAMAVAVAVPVDPLPYLIPGFITTQPRLIAFLNTPIELNRNPIDANGKERALQLNIPSFLNSGGMVGQVTGKLGGASMGGQTEFTAIILGNNLFLAQSTSRTYKKGVFFEISKKGEIKATQARYCFIRECRHRDLDFSDRHGSIATNQQENGYGIFDVTVDLTTNLAFKKATTQSSTYSNSANSSSSKAVDGNTSGDWNAHSVSSTKKEQGAWWQVDLGSTKLIKQIHLFNRADCCIERLSYYRVSIADDSDFKRTTYQKIFYSYPKVPMEPIDLSMRSVQGRYIKIQLLGNNFLSLAEVQVAGFDISVQAIAQ